MSERKCFRCGRNGSEDPLDRHHIFGGAYRKKSEKYGLVVDLCHSRCHIFGYASVHQNGKTMMQMKRYGQLKAMREQGWTEDEFRREFGKSYLEEDDMKLTQCERIIRHLREIGPIDDLTAFNEYGIRRLASRIHDLKVQGYDIVSETKTGKNRYGESTHYAVYRLKEETV